VSVTGPAVLIAIVAGLAGGLIGLFAGLAAGRARRQALRHALDRTDAVLKTQAQLDSEREEALARATERLTGVFGQLANQQLQSHSETFLKLARESLGSHHERAKGELAAREQAVENLIQPIKEALARTEAQIRELESGRLEAHGSITAQLEAMAAGQKALGTETRNLVNALRRPEVRGQWGEITLRRLVELAGMVEHCDFVTQAHRATPDGAIRPDMVIRMPDRRRIVVDVKTPLDAYLEAIQCEDAETRRVALRRHAANVAARIDELAGKAYWAQFEDSPDFVILFIPGDQFLSAALAERPELLDSALRQHVIPATPTSLVALLKAIAYGWQQAALAENAEEIRVLGVQLYERLSRFGKHLRTVGEELGNSVKAYNQAVGSLERRVLPSARRFTQLGINPGGRLEAVKLVEESPRAPAPPQEDAGAGEAPAGGRPTG